MESVDGLFRLQLYGYKPSRGPTTWQLFDETPLGSGIASVTLQAWHSSHIEVNGIDLPGRYSSVAPNYFDVLQTRPRLGRLFRPDEAAANNVAVVSDAFWKHNFRNRPEIGGATQALYFAQRSSRVVLL